MNISVKWLKELIDFDLSTEELSEKLMMLGIETDAVTYLDTFGDAILKLEITPNRPDCLSHIGIAREIGTITGNSIRFPKIEFNEIEISVNEFTDVQIDAPDLCPRYSARIVRNVKIGSSPKWLRDRLNAIGISSINNVVDITNFVMLEMGQPLHAFDYHKLAENRIIVRRARSGEVPKTLDEESHVLTNEMLVIADAKKPIAVAGVMGGLESAVSDRTTDILLESAYFNPISVRKTSKALGMRTDSSHRFERGTDPNGVVIAINRAAQLIAEIADGEIAKGVIDIYPKPIYPIRITLRPERVNFVLGTEIETAQMIEILTRLGFEIESNGKLLFVKVPTFRPDIDREIDLIEEIARVYGYDQIPVSLPTGEIPIPDENPRSKLQKKIRNYLLSAGMMEAINYSFYNSNVFDLMRLDASDDLRNAIPIQNPLNEDFSTMRTTLIPSLLENVRRNTSRQVPDVAFFEIAKVFSQSDKSLPNETFRISGILSGNSGSEIFGTPHKPIDFFDLKGLVEGLLNNYNITEIKLKRSGNPTFHHGKSAEIFVADRSIGVFGEVHPQVVENFDLRQTAFVFELDFEQLSDLATLETQFEPISIYPNVRRDLAIVVDDSVNADKPLAVIRSVGGDLVKSAFLFDVYAGRQIEIGKKSLAYAISFHSKTETLTDEIVDARHAEILTTLEDQIGAVLRS